MDKRALSETDICTKFITPALRQAGWDVDSQIREEVSFTKGRIIVRGKLVGHWIKTLSVLQETYVYFAETPSAEEAAEMESQLIKAYISKVSTNAKQKLRDPSHPFPFANLEFPKGTRKAHGISKAKLTD